MREKRIRGQSKSEPLFEYNLDTISPNEHFQLDLSEVPPSEIEKLTTSYKDHIKAFEHTAHLVKNEQLQDNPTPISSEDPLNPELFLGHHRRMEREERRMQLLERQQLMIAQQKIKQQLELLQHADWKNSIAKIVKIDNMKDQKELSRKRDLALNEMTTFLVKFDENNRRSNRRDQKYEKKKKKKKKKVSAAPVVKRMEPKPKDGLPSFDQFVDLNEPVISIRPFAFGGMLPRLPFPPADFELPFMYTLEAESMDLVDRLREERKELNIS